MAHHWDRAVHIVTPCATLELCHHRWPTPNEVFQQEEAPTLSLNLTGCRETKSGRYQDTDQSGYFPMGDVMFQPAGTTLHSRGAGGVQRFLRVSFHPEAIDDTIDLTPDHARPDVQSNLLNIRAPSVLPSLRRALSEIESPGMASAFLLDGLSMLMAVELARYLTQGQEDGGLIRGGLASWQLRRIDERIHDVAATSPTVAELAALIRLSPRHLARAYRISRGCTLSETIESTRHARAEQMVLASEYPLKEIAHRLGFSSTSSFSTAFRRRAACSPQEFAHRARR